jgi:uncharacterized protein (DUF58 family)
VVTNVGEPRGPRPYRPGDDRRHVHWPAFAHTGELMVREREGPAAAPLTLRVTLPDDIDQAERVAEKALGTILHLLDRGVPLLLETVEPSGSAKSPVEDRRSAGRRLAQAVGGTGGRQPSPAGAASGGRRDRPAPADVTIEATS